MKPSTPNPAAARKAPPPARSDSSGSLLALVFFVTTVILGGLAWWQHDGAAKANARVAELEDEIASLKKAQVREETPSPVARTVAPEPMPADEPPAPPPANQRGAAVLGAIGNLLNSNPQLQQLAAGMTQTLVTNAYSGFVQQMNMSEEQAGAFNALVAQRALVGQQVLREASAQGLDLQANGAQLQQQVRQGEAQVDQQIHGLLGDGGFQQYQDYSRNVQQQLRGGLQGR